MTGSFVMELHKCLIHINVYAIHTWKSRRHFLKNKQMNLSLQGSQLVVYILCDKLCAFQVKIGILKTCICHHVLNSFLIHHDFADKIHGHSDECGFQVTLESMLTFGSHVLCIKPQCCNAVLIKICMEKRPARDHD